MKNLFLAIIVLGSTATSSFAQNIGYANVNGIFSLMPETKKMNEDLQIYATGLQKGVDDMKGQLDAIVKQFNDFLAAGDTAKALEIQKQGLAGDKQLQQAVQSAEQQLAQKRGELSQPITDKILGAMQSVAKKKDFDYVLNSVDGSGISIVLLAPDGHDITRAVIDELGIKLEGAKEVPAQDGKKKKK
ncbi:OmpH family outer membrane protein [Flavobacteriales bacterium]|nr:OmpH family outer membrane protein [Flavobacteriales bacterium]